MNVTRTCRHNDRNASIHAMGMVSVCGSANDGWRGFARAPWGVQRCETQGV